MAQYPTSAATDANLYVAVNSKSTTLAGALTSVGGNNGADIEVTDTTGFPSTGFITIDQEAISYTSILSGPPRFAGITRGADGTTATAHSAGSTVKHNVIAAHHNAPKDEIIAIEADLVAARGTLTPNAPSAVDANLLDRIESIVYQIKALHGNMSLWNSTIPGGFEKLFHYRRPTLQWSSITQVNTENVVTSGQIDVLFPDGEYRTETSATLYNFVITRNAVLTGSKQSGLRTSLSEATNTWYALYAVKAQDSTGIVVVGDTVLPLLANFSTLNSNFGTNGWVYLGLIRNGDNSGATGDILNFVQAGNMTIFKNATAGGHGMTISGIILATTASATSLTYTYSSGTGTTDIPGNIGLANYEGDRGNVSASWSIDNAANTFSRFSLNSPGIGGTTVWAPATDGVHVTFGTTTSGTICLYGFIDTVLGVGSNPLF